MDNTATPDKGDHNEGPRHYEHYNINPDLRACNFTDDNGNPSGGKVSSVGLDIEWQNGPRGQEGTDELAPPNGAFLEDAIYAAIQRLQFFQDSPYRDRGNAIAITRLEEALQALKHRQVERSYRGVEGKNEL